MTDLQASYCRPSSGPAHGRRHGRPGRRVEPSPASPRATSSSVCRAGEPCASRTARAFENSIPDRPRCRPRLGVLGMPGMTAWCALMDIGRPQPGETVVVSAAAGAVGSVVGQLAKIKGCRAIGIRRRRGQVRLRSARGLGLDACFNYSPRRPSRNGARQSRCPQGVDVYFENVGGWRGRPPSCPLNHFAPHPPWRI